MTSPTCPTGPAAPGGRDNGDPVADYEALRRRSGAHLAERDVVLVTGPEAESYLQGQLSQDVAGMAEGTARDALLLEPDGKLSALVRVTRIGDHRFVLDIDHGAGAAAAARLGRFRLRTKVDLELVTWPCVGLRGPETAAAHDLVGSLGGSDGPWALPVSWNGASGLDVLGPGAPAAVPGGVRWCGDAAWEALRIEAGIPAMGRELDGRTIAAEAGLVERTVSLSKGCYTGQELVARLDARGNRVARRLQGLVVVAPHGAPAGSAAGPSTVGSAVVDEVLRPGVALFDPEGGKEVGTCTSAAWCPGVGAVAGLGYLHRSVRVPGRVAVGAPDGPSVAARPLPLVPGGR